MRILGIDYGDKRIGTAVSDPFGWTAQGIGTIHYNDINTAIEKIVQLINKYSVEKLVVGMPKNMNGTIGPRCEKTFEFIELLKNATDKEIIEWDERLTTAAAENVLIGSNMRREKRKKVIDTVAATYILQGYLNYLSAKPNNE